MSKRLPDSFSNFSKTRKNVLNYISRTFEKVSADQRFWLGFAFLCILTTFLINNPFWRSAPGEQYKEGDIARESIISPADITVTDDAETARLREIARDSVQPIFRLDANRSEEAVQSFRSSWESLRRTSDALNSNSANKNNANSAVNTRWKGAGEAEVGRIFSARNFSSNELEAVTRVLRENSTGSIYDDKDREFLQNDIALIDPKKPNQQSTVSMAESSMTSLSDARNNLLDGLKQIRSLSDTEVQAFNSALAPLIQASVVFDSVLTEKSKESIAHSVEPVTISLKRGQTIVREGDTITPYVLSQISAIRSYSSSTRNVNRFFGLLVLISALFWAAWKFIQHRGVVPRLTLSEERTFALFGFIVVVQTALMAVFFRLSEFTALQNVKAPLNDPSLWAFAIPFAFGSLLMTLLADRRTALFTGLLFL